MAYPEPSNVAPWYLRNINQALALDETSMYARMYRLQLHLP